MATHINRIDVRNYRALAHINLQLGPIGVFFGPNGSGKSTLLDTMWFLHDCATRGVETAAAQRSQGLGMLFDGARSEDQRLAIELSTDDVRYGLVLDLTFGRIDPLPGELLMAVQETRPRIERRAGAAVAQLTDGDTGRTDSHKLREPARLALSLYLDLNPGDRPAEQFDRMLRGLSLYHSRSLDLRKLRTLGSTSGPGMHLDEFGDNAWSVLRNLRDRERDGRFRTILSFMREAFPALDDINFEQTGVASVYAQFYEKHRRHAMPASAVSDGHLQLLLMLTALFCGDSAEGAVVLLDEPEVSLHPWALAVLAKAVREAAGERWARQVLIATHSPVLISQFEPDEIFAAEPDIRGTRLHRISDIEGIRDLLSEYAAGSLYMAEMIGAQADRDIAR